MSDATNHKSSTKDFGYQLLSRLINLWFAVSIVIALALVVSIYRSHYDPTGEPWSTSGGVSIWMTEIIRLVACIATGFFILEGLVRFNLAKLQISRYFKLPAPTLRYTHFGHIIRYLKTSPQEIWIKLGMWIAKFFLILRRPEKLFESDSAAKSVLEPVSVKAVWKQFTHSTNTPMLLAYSFLLAIFLMGCAILIVKTFGSPVVPARGDLAFNTDQFMLRFCLFWLYFLLSMIILINHRTSRLIKDLSFHWTKWPREIVNPRSTINASATADEEDLFPKRLVEAIAENSTKKVSTESTNPEISESENPDITHHYLFEWLKISLIAKITTPGMNLIVGPFFILFLMLLSRWDKFDRWTWPLGLVLVILIFFAIVLFSAIRLRTVAESARKRALARLARAKLEVIDFSLSPNPNSEFANHEKLIDTAMEQIRGLKRGAFEPLSTNPILVAILVPFGGAGGIVLLEYILSNSTL
ncbi:hypothetical protein [Cerasicoccus frondis]|uniref:hypothetical protein n=1 Tax=Cerasicoccus frondis TaxID=490090 RepID=UPI002852AA97|nr:hypothetical protein [Cerasicoccus frondis]